MQTVFLGIGTNLGNRENNLREALIKIEEYLGKIIVVSSVWETAPWGFMAEAEFLNMAVELETIYSPSMLMERVLIVESLLGRVRSEERYSSRLIDIDILFYAEQSIDEPGKSSSSPYASEAFCTCAPLRNRPLSDSSCFKGICCFAARTLH